MRLLPKRKKFDEAQNYFEQATTVVQDVDNPWTVCTILIEWGHAAQKQQNWDLAHEKFAQALPIVQELDIPEMYADYNYGLGRIAAGRKNTAEAKHFGTIALKLYEEMGHINANDVQKWLDSLPQV